MMRRRKYLACLFPVMLLGAALGCWLVVQGSLWEGLSIGAFFVIGPVISAVQGR